MPIWTTMAIADGLRVEAPDGSTVEIGPILSGGSFARFSLEAGRIARAVRHRSVEEIWCVSEGAGQMWRRLGDDEEIVDLAPGTVITIPKGVAFQFRAAGDQGLAAIAVTMPPWPGEDEAIFCEGPWRPVLAGTAS